MADPSDALVSTDWLAERLGAPDVRVVDATWFLPNAGRDARAEYAAAHIPGVVGPLRIDEGLVCCIRCLARQHGAPDGAQRAHLF